MEEKRPVDRMRLLEERGDGMKRVKNKQERLEAVGGAGGGAGVVGVRLPRSEQACLVEQFIIVSPVTVSVAWPRCSYNKT